MEIRPATLFDLAAVGRLLREARLPVADVAEHLGSFQVGEEAGVLLATGGLEIHGQDALLRSVAVTAARRRQGLGRALVQVLLEDAARREIREVWLLTEGAAGFFGTLGFQPAERTAAPRALRASRQFTTLCPESALLMRRPLG